MIRILHVITDLDTGGAEISLCRLLKRLDPTRFLCSVLSLQDRGTKGIELEKMGIPVHTVGLSPGRLTLPNFGDLFRSVSSNRPDLIQGWMYHGNLGAWGLRWWRSVRRPVLVWNIRGTVYDLQKEKPCTRQIIKMGARLSANSDQIIYNSRVSSHQHERIGYCSGRTVVIPNGFDTSVFKPDRRMRQWLRSKLELSREAILIGHVARFHAMKDHNNFLAAAKILSIQYSGVHFIMIGCGIDAGNSVLQRMIRTHGLVNNIHLLGERSDMARLYAAFDIVTMSSAYGEGFPNVIGEAMACGVPCVVTDVGDTPRLVGETGRLVPPENSRKLASAWRELLEMGREARTNLGKRARRRIITDFSMAAMVAKYENLYTDLCTLR